MIDKPPLFHTATRDSDRSNANTAFRLRSFLFKFFCSHRLSFSFVLLVGFLSAISLPDFVIARFPPPPRPASHPPLPPRRPEGGWFPLRIERIERSQRGSTRRSRTPSALLRETTWPQKHDTTFAVALGDAHANSVSRAWAPIPSPSWCIGYTVSRVLYTGACGARRSK